MKKQTGLYALAVLVIFSTVGFLALLCLHESPEGNKDAVMMALGSMISAFGTVIGYFFGSSKGSAEKNAALFKTEEPK